MGRADYVEACLLLVGQRVIEIGQRRFHSVDRVGKGIEAFGHRIEFEPPMSPAYPPGRTC